MKSFSKYGCFALSALAFSGCVDDEVVCEKVDFTPLTKSEVEEMTYSGGKLGTSFTFSASAYQQPSSAVEQQGFYSMFKYGETLFERDYVQEKGTAFSGLGPLMVRKGCLYCHPNYGHGKRQIEYRANEMGNGYLLVIYDKKTNGYLTSITGMPQTLAVKPFKAPIDETQIKINWKHFTDDHGNAFPDGEMYDLIYPEVTIPESAFYVPLEGTRNGETVQIPYEDIEVRLESTIGIYGTGLIDAIPDDSITAQWKKESPYVELNPAMWDAGAGTWASYYKGLTGKPYVRRFTYALSRGPLLDAAGANAVWNITNVTRSDRKYHYMTATYAKVSSQDPDVQASFYDYFPEERTAAGVEADIYRYLMGKADGKNIAEPEMKDADYKDFMVWHRGLAVPAARDLNDAQVQKGMRKFKQIGCAQCHRPSWQTGEDDIQDPNGTFTNADMPRYPNQKIWPYTDMVQHRLMMENDIRTGWCRTTPLWGRGLSKLCTGGEDRLHDCRARNTLESIMWHGGEKSDARESVEKFRNLTKEERDAIVKFLESI